MIDLRILRGDQVTPHLHDVAQLRISVFADWPYLYDGDLTYEAQYLRHYEQAAGAIVAAAFDGDRLIGAATGTPLTDHADDFAAAFAGSGYDLGDIFYCAESVLLPHYRGQGLGHRFFDAREDHARALGYKYSAFCAVQRPADHPARPAEYRSLDEFWRGRGYAPLPGVQAQFSWRDLGDADETLKPLQFWLRKL